MPRNLRTTRSFAKERSPAKNMLTKYLEIVNDLRYRLGLSKSPYPNPLAPQPKQKLLDSKDVLPELPSGIPFFSEQLDEKRQAEIKEAVRKIRIFLFHELSLKDTCCGSLSQHTDTKHLISLFE